MTVGLRMPRSTPLMRVRCSSASKANSSWDRRRASDLTQLNAGQWIGVSPLIAGRRSSFDTYDYQIALQLSEGIWLIEFIAPAGLVRASGDKDVTWRVPAGEALKRVYAFSYSVKSDDQDGLRELAITFFSTAIGGGLTGVVTAGRSLLQSRR
jgi:hypothetical protein